MVTDAESHAEDDKRLRELAEARNNGENAAYQAERQLKELGDAVDASSKEEIEAAIKAVREVLTSEDAADINAKTEALQASFHKVSEAMYQRAQEQAEAASADGAGAATNGAGTGRGGRRRRRGRGRGQVTNGASTRPAHTMWSRRPSRRDDSGASGARGRPEPEEPGAVVPDAPHQCRTQPRPSGRGRAADDQDVPETRAPTAAELDAEAEKADEYLELAQRTKADFENYRKRAVARSGGRAGARRGQARQGAAAGGRQPRPCAERRPTSSRGRPRCCLGIKLVHADVIAALARVGIEPFSPEGEPFDPATPRGGRPAAGRGRRAGDGRRGLPARLPARRHRAAPGPGRRRGVGARDG